ncbi:MAG: hypothetical protein HYY20_02940 [Candidatus Tectomicrobia bacterium]|uniref:Uncharacterized protein n=1 Tax=Tectimicrobiota bacterium TaxID=2528274 RepID=A0A932FXT1_UNCTE|nr:hypothetical protein [Candidatus Tectomicrobia bacterium]
MAIQCPQCKRQYDVTLFEFGRVAFCDCGEIVDATKPHEERAPEILREEQANAEELQRMASEVCYLILSSDFPWIDIEIAKTEVRERCRQLFPDKMELYEMIYESRFKRLWEQFREGEE